MDRLRGSGEDGDERGVPSDLADAVAESLINEDEEKEKETTQKAKDEFRMSLSNTLGVNPSDINDSFVNKVGDMFGGLTNKDVLTQDAIKNLGLSGGSEKEESGQDKDEPEESKGGFLDE